MVTTAVRPMRPEDLPTAAAISADAGVRFASIAEPRIAVCADDPPFTIEELQAYVDAGRAWVALDDGVVVGLLVAGVVDGDAHVDEVAVAPDAGRQGHGDRLLATMVAWAAAAGHEAVTLTTFRDVPWNAPWYARRGFRVLHEHELTPGLRAVRDREDADGLARELRVVMRLDVEGGGR